MTMMILDLMPCMHATAPDGKHKASFGKTCVREEKLHLAWVESKVAFDCSKALSWRFIGPCNTFYPRFGIEICGRTLRDRISKLNPFVTSSLCSYSYLLFDLSIIMSHKS